MPAGSYSDTITFVNSSAETISRTVELAIEEVTLSLAAAEFEGGEFVLILRGEPLRTYIIEASPDLAQWSAVATNAAGADGLLTLTDSEASLLERRFYRACEHP